MSTEIQTTIGWRLSHHAKVNAALRGVPIKQVLEVIADPETTYPSGDRTVLVKGDLAVVVEMHQKIVITVLLHTYQPWDDRLAREIFGAAD